MISFSQNLPWSALLLLVAFLNPLRLLAASDEPFIYHNNQVRSGTLTFAEIPQLPERWWKDTDQVWTVWDRNTFYLWGANEGNYNKPNLGSLLKGSGMASEHGPSRGRSHPHYRGVITTSVAYQKNNIVFAALAAELASGHQLIVPVFHGKMALGAGIAVKRFKNSEGWLLSQIDILAHLSKLIEQADVVDFGDETFWADCSRINCTAEATAKDFTFSVKAPEDLQAIQAYLAKRLAEERSNRLSSPD